MEFRQKKLFTPAGEPLEGTLWLGVSFATQSRLFIQWEIASEESSLAEPLLSNTEDRLSRGCWPIWTSDGLDAYGNALKMRHHLIQTFPRTGKRGRPRRPKLVAHPNLLYGQVVKHRNERHYVTHVEKRAVYGPVPSANITTSYIERQNLNLRHENRRLTRKTIAFSKKADAFKDQVAFYQAAFNLTRPHRGLARKIEKPAAGCMRKWQPVTPAMAAGITDHVWSLKELLSYRLLS